MAEDLSIKVKVEPDVSDLPGKLKTAGASVGLIPVKVVLTNLMGVSNQIEMLERDIDVGINVKLNNTVDIDSITSKLKDQTVEIATKLNLDLDESEIGEIQTRLNEISKKLRLNLKVADKKTLPASWRKPPTRWSNPLTRLQKRWKLKLANLCE